MFGGYPREQSFEEMRTRHYQLAIQGKEQEAIEEARALVSNSEAQMRSALNDVDGAIKYILDGENEHPNRIDICNVEGGSRIPKQNIISSMQAASSFGQPLNNTSAFRHPPAPSTFGQPSISTFGQPSAPTSSFSQKSAQSLGPPSFGQASTLGRPQTSFGQSTPAVGQPTAPGPFGNSQAPPPSHFQSANPFQTSIPPSQQPLSFGRPSAQPQTGLFAQPSASNTGDSFTRTPSAQTLTVQDTAARQNSFTPALASGAAMRTQNARASPTAFSTTVSAQQNEGFGQASGSHASRRTVSGRLVASAQVQKDGQGKLVKWNGATVSYIDGDPCHRGTDGNWQKIWFPDGAPNFVNSGGLSDDAYDDEMKENYEYLKDNGIFKGGIIPLLPPKREWCNWNV